MRHNYSVPDGQDTRSVLAIAVAAITAAAGEKHFALDFFLMASIINLVLMLHVWKFCSLP